jgi:hypothetical protein
MVNHRNPDGQVFRQRCASLHFRLHVLRVYMFLQHTLEMFRRRQELFPDHSITGPCYFSSQGDDDVDRLNELLHFWRFVLFLIGRRVLETIHLRLESPLW